MELLEGFEFDSDIDMPREDSEHKNAASHPPEEPERLISDPWNAVCVVGLRVYSQDPQLCLQVVRPVADTGTKAALDRDDPSASATNEGLERMI